MARQATASEAFPGSFTNILNLLQDRLLDMVRSDFIIPDTQETCSSTKGCQNMLIKTTGSSWSL